MASIVFGAGTSHTPMLNAAAHDRHVGALVAGERPEPERRSRAGAVGRVRRPGVVVQGKVHGPATVRHFQACRAGCVVFWGGQRGERDLAGPPRPRHPA